MFNVKSFDYLTNKDLTYNITQMPADYYWDTPVTGYHTSWPYTGINCMTSKDNEKFVYLISSQSLYSRQYWRACNYQKRTVSVFKRDLNISKNVEHLVIGNVYTPPISNEYKCYRYNNEDTNKFGLLRYGSQERNDKEKEVCLERDGYWRADHGNNLRGCGCNCCVKRPKSVGGLGSDYITSCGIDEESNILYYIGGNYHQCISNYNTKPSIVRINLTSFEFIDRTILNEMSGYGTEGNWKLNILERQEYFNYPGSSELINGKIFLSFRTPNTGVWVINVRSFPILLENSNQKKLTRLVTEIDGNETNEYTITYTIPTLTKSYYNKENNVLYFASEEFTSNAQLLSINLTEPNYFNKSSVIGLNGINNIKSIKYYDDYYYILSGQITTNLYKLDKEFNVISLSATCGIDSLLFPTEWSVAGGMELDELTGLLYVFFINSPYAGFSIVRIKDFTYGSFNYFKFAYYNRYEWIPQYMNTTILNKKTGKLLVSTAANENSWFKAISEISLLGCSQGRRVYNNSCSKCERGTFTNEYGALNCNLCGYGHSTLEMESKECTMCVKGYYADVLGSTSCKDCPGGKYTELNGANICSNCEAGKYNSKTKSITPTDCLDCLVGTRSNFSAVSCSNCPIGKFVLNRKTCIDCPLGKYSNTLGIDLRSKCKDCPSGRYNNVTGASDLNLCIYCAAGKFNLDTGGKSEQVCRDCGEGKFKPTKFETNTPCVICENGKYSGVGSVECSNCEIGKYNRGLKSIDHVKCIDCPRGRYNPNEGSDNLNDCIMCPSGKYGILNSASSLNDCKFCVKGKYSSELGSFQELSCKLCPAGKYGESESAQSIDNCKNCPLGKFNTLQGMITIENCSTCGRGSFNQVLGSSKLSDCIKCAAGKYIISELGTNADNCVNCQLGKYNPNVGSFGENSCISCVRGTYNEVLGSSKLSDCVKCSPGRYIARELGTNADNCVNCPLGKYNPNTGSFGENSCVSCVRGTYNEIELSVTALDCIKCPSGKYIKEILGTSVNDCLDCPSGFYSLEGYLNCIDCKAGKYSPTVSSTFCTSCEEGRYSSLNATIGCTNCPLNSEPNRNFDRCNCIEGTYMVSEEPLVCKSCPDKFTCPRGSTIETIILDVGYWRSVNNTLLVEKCRKTYNCIGGRLLNGSSNSLCNKGHMGPICDVCLDGWAKNEGKCFECLTDTTTAVRSYFFTAVFPLLIGCIIYFMIRTANPNTSSVQKEPLSGVIKIFMNYAQIFSLASSFEINWPEIVLNLFDRTKEFSSPRISFYSSDCTIGWDYYDKLLVYLLLPIFYIFFVLGVLGFYTYFIYKGCRNKKLKTLYGEELAIYKKNNPEENIFFRAWSYTSVLIGIFLAWPTVIKQSLSIIPCRLYGDKHYLLADLSIECYTKRYTENLVLCYFSLIFYGIFVPICAFNLLRMKRFSLYDFDSKYEMPAPISFLFLGYREEVWYYEFIVMSKKYSLILITVFLKEFSRYQMICASLFVQIAFFIHVFLRPYDSITNYGILCNKLESLSLLALVVTLNSGLFFGTIQDDYKLGLFEIILIILLFVMNISVFVYFMYNIVILSYKELKNLVKKIFVKLENRNSCLLNKITDERKEKIMAWVNRKEIDTFGIKLRTPDEIELFNYFFNDKRMFTNELKKVLEDKKIKKISNILNHIKCKIEIVEKQRCWLTILNNRMYKKLREELINNKDKIDKNSLSKLDKILGDYIDSGLRYSQTVDIISKKALGSIKRESVMNLKDLHIEEKSQKVIEIKEYEMTEITKDVESFNVIIKPKMNLSNLSVGSNNLSLSSSTSFDCEEGVVI